jgi:hypothetical protein
MAKFWEVATDPHFGRVNIEYPPTDYARMIQYTLTFPEPVDYLIPTNLTGFYTIWFVQKSSQPYPDGTPADGRVWFVRFQVPPDAIDVNNQAMCYGSFVGVQN